MHTLWRNGEMLGRIDDPPGKRSKDPSFLVGILRPTTAFSGTEPMVQVRLPLPTAMTIQHPIDFLALDSPSNAKQARARVEIRADGPPAKDVPDREKLVIRSADGAAVDCTYISLMRVIAPDEVPLAEIQRQLGTTADERHFWMIMAHLTPPAPSQEPGSPFPGAPA
jgi:hypothetical protein